MLFYFLELARVGSQFQRLFVYFLPECLRHIRGVIVTVFHEHLPDKLERSEIVSEPDEGVLEFGGSVISFLEEFIVATPDNNGIWFKGDYGFKNLPDPVAC